MSDTFTVPDEVDLLAFFGGEPVERSVDDGYWCYEVADSRNVVLRLSFNLFERSVQTTLVVGGMALATVVHEGAQNMALSGQTLTCRFSYVGARTTLVVRLVDAINVEWSSLRTA